MNGDADPFESLRRLLALKRHEQPPPGYFQNFSSRVIARIEAGETGEESRGVRTWLQWMWAPIEQRPVFAGAFGAAVCALLIASLVNSEVSLNKSMPILPTIAVAPASSTHPGLPAEVAVQNSDTNSIQRLFGEMQRRAEDQLKVEAAGSSVDLLGGQ